MRTSCIPLTFCLCLVTFPLVLAADDYYIQWADTLDISHLDIAYGVAVDDFDNIIVTGPTNVGGDYLHDYFTVKYDPSGTILWQDIIDDNGKVSNVRDIVVDHSNNIIVTGYCIISGYANYFTVKYDSDGTVLWHDTINNDRHDTALGVTVDNSNNIIVAGYSVFPGPDCDYYTVKYDSNGTILWQDTIDNRLYDYAHGVATDDSNNIIVTGCTGDPIGVGYDCFTVKYDSEGNIVWREITDDGFQSVAYSVAVDNSQNIFVTGCCSIIEGDNDYFTVKYAPDGAILWQDTIKSSSSSDVAQSVAVDNSNNIIVTGFSSMDSNEDYLSVKYDSSGTILWQDAIDNGDHDHAYGVAVDNIDNVIVTGTSDIDGDPDFYTVKYVPVITGVPGDEELGTLTKNPVLNCVYPNPANPHMSISFTTDRSQEVRISVYDMTGRRVAVLADQVYGTGLHALEWDGDDTTGKAVSCGTYLVRMETLGNVESRKITFVR